MFLTSSATKLWIRTMLAAGLAAAQNFNSCAAKGMKVVLEQLSYEPEGRIVSVHCTIAS